MAQKSKIILGIDPGTVIMGYGILSVTGKQIKMLEMNVIKLNGKKDMFERLGTINNVIQEIIDKYKPDDMAIEAPFFGKNVQSMLKLGRAQGVAIAVAMCLSCCCLSSFQRTWTGYNSCSNKEKHPCQKIRRMGGFYQEQSWKDWIKRRKIYFSLMRK